MIGVHPRILLILTGDDCGHAVEVALNHAHATSNALRVVQILASDLYRYGHQDLVATRPSKRQFLLHIRKEVIERGKAEIHCLEKKAWGMGIPLEIATVESEDVFSTSLSEVKKGYDIAFLPKQEKRLFPLFKRTLAKHLQRNALGKIVVC